MADRVSENRQVSLPNTPTNYKEWVGGYGAILRKESKDGNISHYLDLSVPGKKFPLKYEIDSESYEQLKATTHDSLLDTDTRVILTSETAARIAHELNPNSTDNLTYLVIQANATPETQTIDKQRQASVALANTTTMKADVFESVDPIDSKIEFR